MAQLFVTTREGVEKVVDVGEEMSLMHLIRERASDELLAICGGCCSCATCHVYVDESFVDRLPEMTGDENDLLDGTVHRTSRSRLSCQIPVTESLDGMRVTIAPED
jgi:2Fe-2S ferredoxin